uniref:Saposin B-type domain-containing protein n=1 Tax=Plectus sambesii TaxID=2011161 RepID=A0A914UGN4_9BILA
MMKSVLLLVFVLAVCQANLCSICTDVVEIAVEYAPQGEDALKQKLDEYCNDLGGFSGICKAFCDSELQNILKYLESGDVNPKDVCHDIRLC